MWKDFERRVARSIGGRRVGPTGTATPDVISDWLRIECKERHALPAWLSDPLRKVRSQTPADALGVVVWHEVGAHDAILVMSFADFVDWFGEPETRADAVQGGQSAA